MTTIITPSAARLISPSATSVSAAPAFRSSLSPLAADVLHTIGRVRAATAHQLLAHFWTEAPVPRSARAGYLVVAKLKKRGLVHVLPLEPERGAVSREVLFLPDTEGVPVSGVRRDIPNLSARQLDAILQTAEVLLVRERQGWRVVPRDETAATYHRAALNPWHAGSLTDEGRALEAMLRQRRELPVPGRVLVRGDGPTLEARLVLAVWTPDAAERIAEGLPLPRVRTLEIELVASDPELADRAVAVLRRAADGAGRPITVWRIAPYRDRANPALAPDPIPEHEVLLAPAVRQPEPMALPRSSIATVAGLPLFSGVPASPPAPGDTARQRGRRGRV